MRTNCRNLTCDSTSNPDQEFDNSYVESPLTSTGFLYFIIIFATAVAVIGTTANLLVIVASVRRPMRPKVFSILILNLAFSDMIFSLIVPIHMIILSLEELTPLRISGMQCKAIDSFFATSATVTPWTMVAIAFNRYSALITSPINLQEPKKWKIILLILVMWFMSFLASTPYIVRSKLIENHGCELSVTHLGDTVHTISVFVLALALPVTIMSILYGKLIFKLQRDEFVCLRNNPTISASIKRKKKAIRTLLTLASVFYLLYFPFEFVHVLSSFLTIKPTKSRDYIDSLTAMLYSVHGCVNPFLYGKLQTSFNIKLKSRWRKAYSVRYGAVEIPMQTIAS